jgi:hypothetical protein
MEPCQQDIVYVSPAILCLPIALALRIISVTRLQITSRRRESPISVQKNPKALDGGAELTVVRVSQLGRPEFQPGGGRYLVVKRGRNVWGVKMRQKHSATW